MAKLIAVGLLVALACHQALLTQGALEGATPVVDQWLKQYGDVFSEIRQLPVLTSDEIIERLEFMRSNMDQVSNNKWIGNHMIYAVNMWYRAITDKNASHCNVYHFYHINHELNDIINLREPPTNNKDRLFEMFYNNIGNFCRTVLADSLNSSLGNQTINDLNNIKVAYDSFQSSDMSIKGLSKRVFGLLNLQKSSTKEEITDVWSRGPCNRLQEVIAKPDNRAAYELIWQRKLRDQIGSNQEQENIDKLFGTRVICEQLDRMLDDMVNDYKSCIIGQLGSLFGKRPS